MDRWFDFIGNDELDGGRLERVLRIEPDHEMKYFILDIASTNVRQTQEEGRKKAGRGGSVWDAVGSG